MSRKEEAKYTGVIIAGREVWTDPHACSVLTLPALQTLGVLVAAELTDARMILPGLILQQDQNGTIVFRRGDKVMAARLGRSTSVPGEGWYQLSLHNYLVQQGNFPGATPYYRLNHDLLWRHNLAGVYVPRDVSVIRVLAPNDRLPPEYDPVDVALVRREKVVH